MANLQIIHRNDFGRLLNELGLNGVGAEIGVERGKYSKALLNGSKLSKLYLIDPWKEYESKSLGMRNFGQNKQDELYMKVVKDLGQYTDRVKIIRSESVTASNMFPDFYFDFVYIDANHSYEYIKEDITCWYPKVKLGGILAGHDYISGLFRGIDYGVKQAVDEFCSANQKQLWITRGRRRRMPSWYLFK